jgi:predicted transcriptional regulator
MMGSMRRFDRHNRQLLLDEGLYPATRAFQIALQIVWHECRAQITEIARAMGDELGATSMPRDLRAPQSIS